MLALQTNLRDPDRLVFSPDGQALLATEVNDVQVWPRWLGAAAHKPKRVQATLERCAFDPTASRVYLYVSGKSHTRVLNLKTGKEHATALPFGGPSWFHFDTAGGFFLVSHDRGKLSRFDLAPESKSGVRQRWSIDRPYAGSDKPGDGPTSLGSHYQFGAICAPAEVFVALEYRYGGEQFAGLTMRSVTDGAVVFRAPLSGAQSASLKDNAGLTLSVHPSGLYFAYPQGRRVRFQALATGVKAPDDLAPRARRRCRAVAFHPSGALLAAAGESGIVTLYDTATWQVAHEFAWDIGELRAVCFSPDGTRAATIAAGTSSGPREAVVGRAVVWDMDV